MSRRVRFALIGCGSIVKKHIVSLSRIEDAELVAVCDANPEAAQRVAEECQVHCYTDCHEMVRAEDCDVISVLTPSGSHARILLELASYGRHFVVEKPLCLRIEDADRVIQACDGSGARIFVVHQNRYNLPVRKLKEAIRQGRLGKIVLGTVRVRWCRRQSYYDANPWRGTWAQDGGVLTNQASHHIDMLSWLLGDVESVMAYTSKRLAKIEAEDTAVAILQFYDGALGIIEATTATRPKDLEGSVSVLGERGAVEIGGFFMNELKTWQFEDHNLEDDTAFSEWGKNPDSFAWNHTEYLRDVVTSLHNGTRGLVDGLEGRKSLELINALYESAETGQRVQLRFRPQSCRLGLE